MYVFLFSSKKKVLVRFFLNIFCVYIYFKKSNLLLVVNVLIFRLGHFPKTQTHLSFFWLHIFRIQFEMIKINQTFVNHKKGVFHHSEFARFKDNKQNKLCHFLWSWYANAWIRWNHLSDVSCSSDKNQAAAVLSQQVGSVLPVCCEVMRNISERKSGSEATPGLSDGCTPHHRTAFTRFSCGPHTWWRCPRGAGEPEPVAQVRPGRQSWGTV